MLRALIALAAVAALAACEAPSSPTVLAGSQPVPAANAAGLFNQVCVANQFDLDGAKATIATMAFTRNSAQDIYYSNTLNLSFKITPTSGGAICSMVWASHDSPARNAATIAAVAPDAQFRDGENGLLSTAILGLP